MENSGTLRTALKTEEKISKNTNSKIYNEENLKIYEVTSMKEAVNLAKDLANDKDIVVMSPASASFDLYKNYKERGKDFKTLVSNL